MKKQTEIRPLFSCARSTVHGSLGPPLNVLPDARQLPRASVAQTWFVGQMLNWRVFSVVRESIAVAMTTVRDAKALPILTIGQQTTSEQDARFACRRGRPRGLKRMTRRSIGMFLATATDSGCHPDCIAQLELISWPPSGFFRREL